MAGSTISCVELLAVAQAAYRENGNELHQSSKDGKVANGILVKEAVYNNKPTVTVTDEDRVHAQNIKDYITQRVMLSKLTGKSLNEFIVKIGDILVQESTSIRNAGLLTWAPKVYADLQKAEDVNQELSVLGITSKYIGQVGSKIEIEFHTVTKRWTQFGCFRYVGHDGNGNLIGFLSKHEYPAVVKIKARIKNCEISKFSGGKTTYLNYTKQV